MAEKKILAERRAQSALPISSEKPLHLLFISEECQDAESKNT